MNTYRAIPVKPSNNRVDHEYKIVYESNHNYVFARIRYENSGPYGKGWNVLFSECHEDYERAVRAMYFKYGRDFGLSVALSLFRDAVAKVDREQEGYMLLSNSENDLA